MIGKKYSICLVMLLSTLIVLVLYQFEQLSSIFVAAKFANHSIREPPSDNDLKMCIKSFLSYHKMEKYAQISNLTSPIYLSFHSSPLSFENLGGNCFQSLYKGKKPQHRVTELENLCFYPYILSDEQSRDLQSAMKTIQMNFEKSNLELVLTAGSYIGSWRYHMMIPYDDDIDFYILSKDKPAVRALLENLSRVKANRFVFKDTEAQNQHWKLGIMCSGDTIGTCTLSVDFFFMWEEGSDMKFLEPPGSIAKSYIYPLVQRPFENTLFKVPRNFQRYMKRQYDSSETECAFRNHGDSEKCPMKVVECDLLNYRYPYKVVSFYNNIFIELIVNKTSVQSVFIDSI